MKRIGLISDTHLEECPESFLRNIQKVFQNVELILHAGDITQYRILDCLESIAPVHAVRGNMDQDISLLHLPRRRIIVTDGFRIGLTHGWGAPQGLYLRVREMFRNDDVSVIVFGHSHHAEIRTCDNCLIINPGSACDRRFSSFRSVAILELGSEGIRHQIVRLENDSE